MIETERLILRNYTMDDFASLYEIVSDPETMQHYPAPFDEEKTRGWIKWNLENYEKYGFGLWAVVLQEQALFTLLFRLAAKKKLMNLQLCLRMMFMKL